MLPGSKKNIKECDNSDNNSGTPDSELDSGISINGHYDNIDQLRKHGHYDRIDEIKTMTGNLEDFTSIVCFFQLTFSQSLESFACLTKHCKSGLKYDFKGII